MAEIGIHLEYVFVFMLQCPFETGYIGRAQSQFSLAFHHEQAFGKLLLQGFDDGGSPVRRTVFNDKYMEAMFQAENGTDYIFYILPFIVGRDNDDAVLCLHIHIWGL